MTTLLEFAQGLAALEIEGVAYDFGMDRPMSLKTAQLPCKYLRAVQSERERFAFDVSGATAHGFGRTMRLQIVIALCPLGLGLPEPNFISTVEMSDYVTLAVTKADVAMSWPQVSTEVTQVSLQGGQEWFWALVATVEATG